MEDFRETLVASSLQLHSLLMKNLGKLSEQSIKSDIRMLRRLIDKVNRQLNGGGSCAGEAQNNRMSRLLMKNSSAQYQEFDEEEFHSAEALSEKIIGMPARKGEKCLQERDRVEILEDIRKLYEVEDEFTSSTTIAIKNTGCSAIGKGEKIWSSCCCSLYIVRPPIMPLQDFRLNSLKIRAYTGGQEANQYVYINPQTNNMEYSSLAYLPEGEPATNYSCVWIFASRDGGSVMRPYIMPGTTRSFTTSLTSGATLQLISEGDNWRVTFNTTSSPNIVYIDPGRGSYVALYTKIDKEELYLVPNTSLSSTRTSNEPNIIVGQRRDVIGRAMSNTHVWLLEEVEYDYSRDMPIPVVPE